MKSRKKRTPRRRKRARVAQPLVAKASENPQAKEAGTPSADKPKHLVQVDGGRYFHEPGHVEVTVGHHGGDPWSLPKPQSIPSQEFKPYLDRVLRGELEALVEFYRNSTNPRHGAFHECVGWLATSPWPEHRRFVRKIMRSGLFTGSLLQKETFDYWYRWLLPLAKVAKKWVRNRVRNQASWNRNQTWVEYFSQRVRPPGLHEKVCPESGHIHVSLNERNELLAQDESRKPPHASCYVGFRVVPKKLFFLLAEDQGAKWRPSHAVRQYMATEMEISYSGPSRKSVRKK